MNSGKRLGYVLFRGLTTGPQVELKPGPVTFREKRSQPKSVIQAPTRATVPICSTRTSFNKTLDLPQVLLHIFG